MPHLRLIGLVLFITAILLALAAAATKTTHIRIQSFGGPSASGPVAIPQNSNPYAPNRPIYPPTNGIESVRGEIPSSLVSEAIQFNSIPVVWPLLFAAGLGLLLWFVQPTAFRSKQPLKARHRRR